MCRSGATKEADSGRPRDTMYTLCKIARVFYLYPHMDCADHVGDRVVVGIKVEQDHPVGVDILPPKGRKCACAHRTP